MYYYFCCVLLILLFSLPITSAQAPGDEDEFCSSPNEVKEHPVFPNNVKILMDSFNYINLLSRSNVTVVPWQQVENDDNGSDPNPALIGFTTVGLIICKS